MTINLAGEGKGVSRFHNKEKTLSFWQEVEGEKKVLQFQIESLKNLIHPTETLLE